MDNQDKTRCYTIECCNIFKEPYWQLDDKTICTHRSLESYTVDTMDLCKRVIRDFLDAPDEKMTRDDVINDFSGFSDEPLTEDTIRKIIDYYNGRKSVYESIVEYLDSGFTQNIDFNVTFPIRKEFNYFTCVNGEREDLVQQLDSYIQIISTTADKISDVEKSFS